MTSVITPGVVLKRHNYAEADRILTLYTKELGKVSAIAKGARKQIAKSSGHLEPGAIIQFELVSTKGMYIVRSAKIMTSYQFTSMSNMQALFVWLELIDKVTHPDDRISDIYVLVERGIAAAASDKPAGRVALLELELYSTIGYKLILDRCILGQEVLNEHENYIDMESGGIVCQTHNKGSSLLAISLQSIKVLRLIQVHSHELLDRLNINSELYQELTAIALQQRRTILDHDLRSSSLQV